MDRAWRHGGPSTREQTAGEVSVDVEGGMVADRRVWGWYPNSGTSGDGNRDDQLDE